jgi:hypothetical protein
MQKHDLGQSITVTAQLEVSPAFNTTVAVVLLL